MSRSVFLLLAACYLLLPAAAVRGQDKPGKNPPGFPGPTDAGFLLPNGWRLTPAGQQVCSTDLPLNIRTTPDGKYALVATNGYNAHELTAIDLATQKKSAVENAPQSWFGLAADEVARPAVVVRRRRRGDSLVRLYWRQAGAARTLPIADKAEDGERRQFANRLSHRRLFRCQNEPAFADDHS